MLIAKIKDYCRTYCNGRASLFFSLLCDTLFLSYDWRSCFAIFFVENAQKWFEIFQSKILTDAPTRLIKICVKKVDLGFFQTCVILFSNHFWLTVVVWDLLNFYSDWRSQFANWKQLFCNCGLRSFKTLKIEVFKDQWIKKTTPVAVCAADGCFQEIDPFLSSFLRETFFFLMIVWKSCLKWH